MSIFNNEVKSVKKLDTKYIEFASTSKLNIKTTIKGFLSSLIIIEGFEKKRKKIKKKLIRLLIASIIILITGTTIIRLLLNSLGYAHIAKAYDFSLFIRNISVVMFLTSFYYLIQLLRFKLIHFPYDVGFTLIPLFKTISDSFDTHGNLEVNFDLTDILNKEVSRREDGNLRLISFAENWFNGTLTLENKNDITWSINTYLTRTFSHRSHYRTEHTVEYTFKYNGTERIYTSDVIYKHISDYKRTLDINCFMQQIKNITI
ncbi:MAG: hypothetical protein OCD02_14740 [Spirochaetaceae bacterium]